MITFKKKIVHKLLFYKNSPSFKILLIITYLKTYQFKKFVNKTMECPFFCMKTNPVHHKNNIDENIIILNTYLEHILPNICIYKFI